LRRPIEAVGRARIGSAHSKIRALLFNIGAKSQNLVESSEILERSLKYGYAKHSQDWVEGLQKHYSGENWVVVWTVWQGSQLNILLLYVGSDPTYSVSYALPWKILFSS
jgi:hypothetical protein